VVSTLASYMSSSSSNLSPETSYLDWCFFVVFLSSQENAGVVPQLGTSKLFLSHHLHNHPTICSYLI